LALCRLLGGPRLLGGAGLLGGGFGLLLGGRLARGGLAGGALLRRHRCRTYRSRRWGRGRRRGRRFRGGSPDARHRWRRAKDDLLFLLDFGLDGRFVGYVAELFLLLFFERGFLGLIPELTGRL